MMKGSGVQHLKISAIASREGGRGAPERRLRWWFGPVVLTGLLLVMPAQAHVFIPQTERAGAYPAYAGDGWRGEVYLNLPDDAATNTITAENYIQGRKPDFTFSTHWIDFPAGPQSFVIDGDLITVGDFFNDYVFDVSDPTKLDLPMSNMLVRFTGLLKVTLEDEVRINTPILLPVWIEFGSFGYDGFNVRVGGNLCYEVFDANSPYSGPWFNWGPAVQAQGLFPIVFTYLNRYDPDGSAGAPFVGFEVYSWHGGGAAYPAGENMLHAERGYGTLAPPWVIYQPGDELPVVRGDFDADADVDAKDAQWLQNCFFPPIGFIILPDGCDAFDFASDNDVDWDDLFEFQSRLQGPD